MRFRVSYALIDKYNPMLGLGYGDRYMTQLKNIVSYQDEGTGLVRLSWTAVRERVAAVNPLFCALMDQFDPGTKFSFYLAYYPYGAKLGDDKSTYIPTMNGTFLTLDNDSLHFSSELKEDLLYAYTPLSMILNKSAEMYIDLKTVQLTLPVIMLYPGSFIATRQLLNLKHGDTESHHIHTVAAGCRSTFMLPPISCSRHFANVREALHINLDKPNNLYQQGPVFAELAQSPFGDCDWRMMVLFFPRLLVETIKHTPRGRDLLLYFYDYAAQHYLNDSLDSELTSLILTRAQEEQKLKGDPYLADTARHIYKIAAGRIPGFVPAVDETHLPRNFLQKMIVEWYGATQYYPTILHPSYFDLQADSPLPVYYCRQYPTTFAASPRIRSNASIKYEFSALQGLLDSTGTGLRSRAPTLDNAFWKRLATLVDIRTFHTTSRNINVTKLSGSLPRVDPRFSEKTCTVLKEGMHFCDEGDFARGFVAIRTKAYLDNLLQEDETLKEGLSVNHRKE